MLVPSIFHDDFVDDMFRDMFVSPFDRSRSFFQQPTMSADIQEYDDKYQIDLELPGYQKEDIQAELKDGYLTIQAEHTDENNEKDEKGKYIRKERYVGKCQRSFYVGEDVKQEDIKANFDNGVLQLTIPKVETSEKVEEKHYIPIEG